MLTNDELPPLPHPVTNALMGDDFEDLYTADQMQEYGQARERAAYERAAKLCDDWRTEHDLDNSLTSIYDNGHFDAAETLAALIRALGADK